MNYVQTVMTPWDACQSQALSAGIMLPAGRRLAKVSASTSCFGIAEANISGCKAVKEFEQKACTFPFLGRSGQKGV